MVDWILASGNILSSDCSANDFVCILVVVVGGDSELLLGPVLDAGSTGIIEKASESPLWCSRLRIQYRSGGVGRNCSAGLIPGLGTSTCPGCASLPLPKKGKETLLP